MAFPMVFVRYEIKYLINREHQAAVMAVMSDHMEPDSFGRSTIRNIYYDTDNYRLARRSLERPIYKEKLRIRSYHKAGPEEEVFVELKKKYNGVVYKRRVSFREKEAEDYLAGRRPAPRSCQITAEIDYFRRFYQTLAPEYSSPASGSLF